MKRVLTLAMLCSFFLSAAFSSAQETKHADQEFEKFLRGALALSPPERKQQLREAVSFQALALGGDVVSHSPVSGKLVPPSVLIGGGAGWDSALESNPTLSRLFPTNNDRQEVAQRVIVSLALLLKDSPEDAFRWMAPRATSSVPTVGDVVKVLAVTQRQPGAPLTQPISKDLWTQFYNSANPCCKIVALEKFDSTAQSPEELLKLYRECLFQTFGYLQVRALEGIFRSKDYRPEVRDLLKEFLASSPVEDDGTLPAFPANFRNPVEGARWLLAEMEKGADAAQKPAVTPVVTNPPVPKTPKVKGEQKPTGTVVPIASNELASAPQNANFLVIWNVVATGGVIVLLVLLLKRRKTS